MTKYGNSDVVDVNIENTLFTSCSLAASLASSSATTAAFSFLSLNTSPDLTSNSLYTWREGGRREGWRREGGGRRKGGREGGGRENDELRMRRRGT